MTIKAKHFVLPNVSQDDDKPLTLLEKEEARSLYEVNGALIYVSSQLDRELNLLLLPPSWRSHHTSSSMLSRFDCLLPHCVRTSERRRKYL
jgi:hypothetical protein